MIILNGANFLSLIAAFLRYDGTRDVLYYHICVTERKMRGTSAEPFCKFSHSS